MSENALTICPVSIEYVGSIANGTLSAIDLAIGVGVTHCSWLLDFTQTPLDSYRSSRCAPFPQTNCSCQTSVLS
ncbi:hypothetical protein CEXT_434931 [Caerostris extrusa]|uniref:Uncharacterized protein n=1 Tax=Caerostris extrusa TaxID=172846 RepID=A0AAV4UDG3_CAEEX|nr:hypothetical protein CEXT_434931 [Caerostris extrusa]